MARGILPAHHLFFTHVSRLRVEFADMGSVGLYDYDSFLKEFNYNTKMFFEWGKKHFNDSNNDYYGLCTFNENLVLPYISTGLGDGEFPVVELLCWDKLVGVQIDCSQNNSQIHQSVIKFDAEYCDFVIKLTNNWNISLRVFEDYDSEDIADSLIEEILMLIDEDKDIAWGKVSNDIEDDLELIRFSIFDISDAFQNIKDITIEIIGPNPNTTLPIMLNTSRISRLDDLINVLQNESKKYFNSS